MLHFMRRTTNPSSGGSIMSAHWLRVELLSLDCKPLWCTFSYCFWTKVWSYITKMAA